MAFTPAPAESVTVKRSSPVVLCAKAGREHRSTTIVWTGFVQKDVVHSFFRRDVDVPELAHNDNCAESGKIERIFLYSSAVSSVQTLFGNSATSRDIS